MKHRDGSGASFSKGILGHRDGSDASFSKGILGHRDGSGMSFFRENSEIVSGNQKSQLSIPPCNSGFYNSFKIAVCLTRNVGQATAGFSIPSKSLSAQPEMWARQQRVFQFLQNRCSNDTEYQQ